MKINFNGRPINIVGIGLTGREAAVPVETQLFKIVFNNFIPVSPCNFTLKISQMTVNKPDKKNHLIPGLLAAVRHDRSYHDHKKAKPVTVPPDTF